MLSPQTLPVPRAGYGLAMLGATAAGLACAYLVASRLGADQTTLAWCLGALAIGSLATFFPVIAAISAEFWGVAVLASGVTRGLVVLGVCFVLSRTNGQIAARPLFLGAVSGTILILVVEVAAALVVLSRLERHRRAGAPRN